MQSPSYQRGNMLSPSHFPFLQLPPELRIQIYCYVLRGSLRSDALACDIDSSILQTCKQIQLESQPCLYTVNVFEAAVWLPVPQYIPWPVLPKNQAFLSRVQHLALYWDARQFHTMTGIQLEQPALRESILRLKQICMALIQAGTRLQTLRVTIKAPRNVNFGHMPHGQYPFLSIPNPRAPLLWGDRDPDVLAPLKELRVRHAVFAGDLSEASQETMRYLHEVKEIIEGYGSHAPQTVSEKAELDLDLMMRRQICYFASALELPTWEDIAHREFLFYTTALREYYMENNELRDRLESTRLMLSYPGTGKSKGLTKLDLGPIFAMLEDVYRAICVDWRSLRTSIPTDIVAARQYFMARPEIRRMKKSTGLADLKN